jgi:hypothetical protein
MALTYNPIGHSMQQLHAAHAPSRAPPYSSQEAVGEVAPGHSLAHPPCRIRRVARRRPLPVAPTIPSLAATAADMDRRRPVWVT